MKRLSILLTTSMPLWGIAQPDFEIRADVDRLQNGDKVFLIYQIDDRHIADSTTVRNGHFEFRGKLDYPVLAGLYLHKDPYKNRLQPGEPIDYLRFYLAPENQAMSATDSLKHIAIDGSEINKLHAELRAMLKKNEDDFAALQKEFVALPAEKQKDKNVFDDFLGRERQLLQQSFLIHLDFVNRHPDSYLSVISLSHIAAQPGLTAEAEKAYQKLAPGLKATPVGREIPVMIASQSNTRIGKTAPDFKQRTVAGREVGLSDFRGKYVLLDFWASWCGPCREENPNIVASYKRFKDKGFEVLGVSLDAPSQRAAWVKAIEKDQLTWTQVSDLKGWDNAAAKLYGIRGIPANFLIDPSGKIIARDLRGAALQEKLSSVLEGK
ncbi:TlpA disulfide reductase family protein [Dyadobacter sp. 676]|uniref:TlpA disulfide reductase family protein n=1 Tax=Dyadobacter sp. 676 TaxID=3088362 RepID=A0AAU8FI53_9BACT